MHLVNQKKKKKRKERKSMACWTTVTSFLMQIPSDGEVKWQNNHIKSI